jgi:hypothetical protein
MKLKKRVGELEDESKYLLTEDIEGLKKTNSKKSKKESRESSNEYKDAGGGI